MEQLSGMDASFLYFETPHAPMHIGSFMIYDPSTAPGGFVRFKDILGHIESRLHLSRAFRQKLVHVPMNLDHPYWVQDDEFDLEFHVRHIALPKPGDWRQLCIQAARLHSRLLDMTRPPWEMYVIEGLDNVDGAPEGSFAVLMKIHHAMIDGVSGSEINEYIHDLEPDPVDKPTAQPYNPAPPPTPFELLARANYNNTTQPFRFMEVLSRTMPGMARLSQGMGSSQIRAIGQAPRTKFNGLVTSHRVVDGKSFPLSDVRAIKSAVPGATVNDAIIAIIGGGLRKYLKHHKELPAESLIAMAPISVRGEGEAGSAGNQVSAMMVEMGTHIEDPLARLQFVFSSTGNSKAMTKAVGARNLADYSQFIPSQLAGLAARLMTSPEVRELTRSAQPAFNTTITNVPGPQTPLYFSGARAVKFVGLGPVTDGMGIIHPVFSYCGQIAVSFTSCREMMTDPEVYADCLQASFEELKSATAGVRSAQEKAPKEKAPKEKAQKKKAPAKRKKLPPKSSWIQGAQQLDLPLAHTLMPDGYGVEISHVIYLVPDAGKAVRFLADVLGFEVTADEVTITGERFLCMASASGGVQLQLTESPLQASITALKRAAGQVDFILQTENINGLIDTVELAGLAVHRPPTPAPYGITAIFEDPFGNLWDIVQRPD